MASLLGQGTRSPVDYDDPKIKLWFHRLDQGIKRRKEEIKDWRRNKNFIDGKHWQGTRGNEDDIVINLCAAYVETRLAETAFRNPRAKLTPENYTGYEQVEVPVIDPETGVKMQPVVDPMTGAPVLDLMGQPQMEPVTRTISRHKVVEGLLNKIADAAGLIDAQRRCVESSQWGYGAIMAGFKPELKPEALDRRKQPEEDADGVPQWQNYEVDPLTGEAIRDDEGYLIPVGGGLIKDKWFTDWAHPEQIIIDPEGGNDFREHAWVALEFTLPLKMVKKSREYENTADLTATGTSYRFDPESDDDGPAVTSVDNLDPYVKDETDAVRLFRIYDLDEKQIIVLADGHGKYLQRKPLPKGIDHSPFVFYRPFERQGKSGEFYPRPPLSDLVPINDEYNKHRKMLMTKVRKEVRKFLAAKGALDNDEMEKLTSPHDMEYVEVDLKKIGVNALSEAVMPVIHQSVGGDAFQYGQRIEMDFWQRAGMPPEAMGAPKAETATQVENMQMHMSLRVEFQRKKLGEALREVYKKLLDSIQTNMTQEQAIMLMGPDGQAFQTMVDHTMIIGDYDVEIDVEEMAPRNRGMQMANFTNLLATIVQGGWDLLADPIGAEAIFEIYGIKDQRLIDAISRMAAQRAQAEQAALLAKTQGPAQTEAVPDSPSTEAEAIAQLAAGRQ